MALDFTPRGSPIDDVIARHLREIAREPSLATCLRQSSLPAATVRAHLYCVCASLARGEELVSSRPALLDTTALAAARGLPHDVRLLLEAITAAKPHLEAWMTSPTYLAILRRTRPWGRR